MADSSSDKFVTEIIDNFIAHGVSVTQNGLIHALALWLDNNIQGESVQKRKQEAGGKFYEFVTNFVGQRSFQRKKWNGSQKLPSSKNEWKKSLEFSSKILTQINELPFEQGLEFIANLYAAWILSCPAVIIRTSSEYKGSISTENETELIEQMFRYLDFLLTHRN
ncbi:MAG: hypothetical protein ACOYZ8_16890 [Chloroflexota bacterium]